MRELLYQQAAGKTDGEEAHIIIRKCQFSDGAEPSGNSIQCENLLRLYQLTFNPTYRQFAEDIFKAVKRNIDNYPPGYGCHIMNLNRYYDKNAATYIIALNEKEEGIAVIKAHLNQNYSPHKAVVFKRKNSSLFPEYLPLDKKTTLYICHQGRCEAPLTDMKEIEAAIRKQG